MIFKLVLLSLLIAGTVFMIYFFIKLSEYEKNNTNDKNDYSNSSYSYDDAYGYAEIPKFNDEK